jgi:hypothetical protein
MQHQSLDLASYIAALPPQIKFDVFSSPWTTQALFRALSPLAQQYILRLLYVDDGVPKGEILVVLAEVLRAGRTRLESAAAAAAAVLCCCRCYYYCNCCCRLYAAMGGVRG